MRHVEAFQQLDVLFARALASMMLLFNVLHGYSLRICEQCRLAACKPGIGLFALRTPSFLPYSALPERPYRPVAQDTALSRR